MNSCIWVYPPLYILQYFKKTKIGAFAPPSHDVQCQTRERRASHVLGSVMGREECRDTLLQESSQIF